MHGEKTLDFDDFKKCLFDAKSKGIYRSQLMFRNKKYEIQTVEVSKVALNRDDDKREAQKDCVSTIGRGHYSLCPKNNYLQSNKHLFCHKSVASHQIQKF